VPQVFRLTTHFRDLKNEQFGPLLHVVTYKAKELDQVIDEINNTGFGLTLGIHSRVEARVAHIVERARVGNIYVNRGMTGAVVGVQPFGGMGLSGTGQSRRPALFVSLRHRENRFGQHDGSWRQYDPDHARRCVTGSDSCRYRRIRRHY
jgi:delta 1-pyrroline-5-carboxylate dehydrogenase